MKEKKSVKVELTRDELQILLNGLQSEKQTMFLGSTREQYIEYHKQIEELFSKICGHRKHLTNFNMINNA